MSIGAIVFCALIVIFILLLIVAVVAKQIDTYKGVRNFSSIVRDEM